jgi:hypothetical protein
MIVAAAHAQGKTNIDRLSECARRMSDSLMSGYRTGDTICLHVAEHPASWIVDQAALGAATARGLHVRPCDGGSRAGIDLAITDIGIDYREIDEIDSLERRARLACSAALTQTGAADSRTARTLEIALVDSIAAADVAAVEAPGYDFAKGSRTADASGGFWNRVVEPAVILGASAVMVILLFTVRSH